MEFTTAYTAASYKYVKLQRNCKNLLKYKQNEKYIYIKAGELKENCLLHNNCCHAMCRVAGMLMLKSATIKRNLH